MFKYAHVSSDTADTLSPENSWNPFQQQPRVAASTASLALVSLSTHPALEHTTYSWLESLPKVVSWMLTSAISFAHQWGCAHVTKKNQPLEALFPFLLHFLLSVFFLANLSFINKELRFKKIISPSLHSSYWDFWMSHAGFACCNIVVPVEHCPYLSNLSHVQAGTVLSNCSSTPCLPTKETPRKASESGFLWILLNWSYFLIHRL